MLFSTAEEVRVTVTLMVHFTGRWRRAGVRLRTRDKIGLTLGLDELTGRLTERQSPGR